VSGVQPVVATYNAIVRAYCLANDTDGALRIVKAALKEDLVVDEWAWSAIMQVRPYLTKSRVV
jgi:pentatricopeptide repeat protein